LDLCLFEENTIWNRELSIFSYLFPLKTRLCTGKMKMPKNSPLSSRHSSLVSFGLFFTFILLPVGITAVFGSDKDKESCVDPKMKTLWRICGLLDLQTPVDQRLFLFSIFLCPFIKRQKIWISLVLKIRKVNNLLRE